MMYNDRPNHDNYMSTISQETPQPSITKFEICLSKISFKYPRGQWVNYSHNKGKEQQNHVHLMRQILYAKKVALTWIPCTGQIIVTAFMLNDVTITKQDHVIHSSLLFHIIKPAVKLGQCNKAQRNVNGVAVSSCINIPELMMLKSIGGRIVCKIISALKSYRACRPGGHYCDFLTCTLSFIHVTKADLLIQVLLSGIFRANL